MTEEKTKKAKCGLVGFLTKSRRGKGRTQGIKNAGLHTDTDTKKPLRAVEFVNYG